MGGQETATVVESRRLGPNHVRLKLRAPGVALRSLPGQFVNVRCTPLAFAARTFDDWETFRRSRRTTEPQPPATLLMRPFAVYRRWPNGPDGGHIEILFKIVGRGTDALARKRPGETLDLVGPLGTGFDLDWCRRLRKAVVVAGGVGLAPLHPLVEYLREHDVDTLVIVGAIREEDVPLETADSRVTLSFMSTEPEVTITCEEYERLGCGLGIVTLEGTRGYKGLPTEMLDRFLHRREAGGHGEMAVFACGPWGMMREVARHAAEHDVRCQVLLEERMGCGVGACMACTCRTKGRTGEVVRKRICVDGPVFEAGEVVWDEG